MKSRIDAELTAEVFNKTRGRCYYCGASAAVLDHATPRCKGGNDEPENLVASCVTCNSAKAGRTIEEFRFIRMRQAGMTFTAVQIAYWEESQGVSLPIAEPLKFWAESQ